MNAKSVGILSVLVASFLWALEPVLAKLSYQTSDFQHTLAMRAILVTVTAFVYSGITNRAGFRIDKVQLSALVYVAIVANVLGDIAYFYALTKISVVNAVLIGNMQPIFIVMLGFLVLKEERLGKYVYVGISVMVLAGVLIATGTLENLLNLRLGTYGDLVVLLATVAWSTTTIAFRKYLKELNAGVVAFYRFLFASLPFVAYVLVFSEIKAVSMYQVAIGVVVGVGTILYFEGLKRNKAAEVSALELTTPLFAAVLGFFALGESIGQIQIVGMLLLFMGVILLSRKGEPVPYRCC
jgi:drug/metabolite transporter (DMT)-like permease